MPNSRIYAAVVLGVVSLTLLLRLVLRVEDSGSIIEAILYLSQFFTILTNMLVLILMMLIVLGFHVSGVITSAITIAIVGVGIIYHAALAHLLDLSGIRLLADHGVHTIVPILTFLWWLFFSLREKFSAALVVSWVAWPIFYCIYIMIRAQGSNFYPYPFLNVTELGIWAVLINVILLSLSFILIGLVMIGISKFFKSQLPLLR